MEVVNFLQQGSWAASWIAVAELSVMEGTIVGLLLKYLRGFLGGMTPLEMRLLQWKLNRLVAMTPADLAILEEQDPKLYLSYMKEKS